MANIIARKKLLFKNNNERRVIIMENKWIRAAIPALLIHISVGTVYCWSTFKTAIAEQIGMSTFAVGWAFSFAIFFLGMSAAFAGKFVERDIHKSSLIACACFTIGMIGTGLVVKYLSGFPALIGIYTFYGAIMGIGLGVGYISPVKTLMLWFSENKGLATGISIMGFGLAKAIATPIMVYLQNRFGISDMFCILGMAYFCLMYIGHLLLKKPEGWVENTESNTFNVLKMFRNKTFLGIWIMFYINIHCGLMIISYEKQILTTVFATAASLTMIVSFIPSLTAGFNALGRIGYSTLSDKMKDRNTVYLIIFLSSILIGSAFVLAMNGSAKIQPFFVILFLLTINAGYGGGFSTLPALLSERFGMKYISQIHGLALSAWAIAGLTGNNTTELILSKTENFAYVVVVAICLYIIALGISWFVVKDKKNK